MNGFMIEVERSRWYEEVRWRDKMIAKSAGAS